MDKGIRMPVAHPLSPLGLSTQEESWKDDYHRRAPAYQRLLTEVLFALESAVTGAHIKTHSVTGRVKSLESLEEKVRRKGYAVPLELGDIIGARVVVLFISDLPRVDALIRKTFSVLASENKVEDSADPSTFGYMSHHYEAVLNPRHTGPRYDGLHNLKFEIQARTLLMDAWANVSHHLAYKSESGIPSELRRDFYALSGLFYVADKHFEVFFDQTARVQEHADESLRSAEPVELNVDSLGVFLARRFPDREHVGRTGVAEVLEELLEFGVTTTAKLEAMLDSVWSEVLQDEKTGELPDVRFADVGFVRSALICAVPEYAAAREAREAAFEASLLPVEDED